MSASQDNLLDYKEHEAQGENLPNQSVVSEVDSEDVVMEYERIIGDPIPNTGCDEEDLFEDDGITDSQLLCATETPTQEDNPEGLDQSLEVVEIPPLEPMDGIESQQNAPLRDGQDIIGQEESVPSPPSVEEIPLGQGDSRHEDEQVSYWSEPSKQEICDFAQELT